MTEKKANEIFRTKYPDGEICRKNTTSAKSKYWVKFNSNGKVYYYSNTSYAELLNQFGFKVVYKHDVIAAEEILKRNEKYLENAKNKKFLPFTFAFVEQNEETEKEEIEILQKEVDKWKEILRHYTEECIID